MSKEVNKKCECIKKIIVPKGKFGAYCDLLDLRSNTCKIDGDSRYFHLYCLLGGQGCPKLKKY